MMMVSDLYWNSHKKLFSLRQQGKVVGHCDNVYVNNPEFVVSEAGRQRVLRNKSKNVHAFIRGKAIIKDKLDSESAAAHTKFYRENYSFSDYSFAVYDPYDECGKFRVLCVIGDIVIRDSNWNGGITMVHAYVYQSKPQLKVKIE